MSFHSPLPTGFDLARHIIGGKRDYQINADGSLTFIGDDTPRVADYRGLLTPSGRVPHFARAEQPEFKAAVSKANDLIERAFGRNPLVGVEGGGE